MGVGAAAQEALNNGYTDIIERAIPRLSVNTSDFIKVLTLILSSLPAKAGLAERNCNGRLENFGHAASSRL